jgi:hypothetical protein
MRAYAASLARTLANTQRRWRCGVGRAGVCGMRRCNTGCCI